MGRCDCNVLVVGHGAGVGGIVHCKSAVKTQSSPVLSRDFGAVHFDRSFEQNRLRLAPIQLLGQKIAENQGFSMPRAQNSPVFPVDNSLTHCNLLDKSTFS